MMRVAAVGILVLAGGALGASFDFELDPVGGAPAGFAFARTGKGAEGSWRVRLVAGAPAGPRVLVQESEDATGYRFPVALAPGIEARDVELSVGFRTLAGREDRAAGLVWRYLDPGNYYLARANALEGNVVAYKVEHGKRTDLDPRGAGDVYGVEAKVPRDRWATLGVTVRGKAFTVRLDGSELFVVDDGTFAGPGRVGLWTKADSVTAFDGFAATVLDAP